MGVFLVLDGVRFNINKFFFFRKELNSFIVVLLINVLMYGNILVKSSFGEVLWFFEYMFSYLWMWVGVILFYGMWILVSFFLRLFIEFIFLSLVVVIV